MTLLIENFRLFCCIANSLEDGCLSCIGAANDKDAKTPGEPSNILCSSPLSFYILCSLEFSIGKRHLSPGCLRWWRWWRMKISAAVGSVLFGYAGSAIGVTSLTHFRTCSNFQLFVLPFIHLSSTVHASYTSSPGSPLKRSLSSFWGLPRGGCRCWRWYCFWAGFGSCWCFISTGDYEFAGGVVFGTIWYVFFFLVIWVDVCFLW